MASLRRWNSAPVDPVPFRRSETDPMIQLEEQQAPTKDNKRTKQMSEMTASTAQMSDCKMSSEEMIEGSEETTTTQTKKCHGWGTDIVKDYRRTVRLHWKQEMTNFNLKVVAVSFFLFFACIAPAITFGAIYAKATQNWIGAVEMIAATAWCGIVYALVGGQPMMINGGTGPVLAFTEILYKMSESMEVPFLTFNAWIGIWVCIYMCIAAVVNLNKILVYATRFTDEIFSFLISTIFIINAIGSPFAPIGVYYYFVPSHKSHQAYENDPNYDYLTTALFSLLIFIGTVQLSFLLRKVKFSPFLYCQLARNIMTDFAVVLSIVLWTGVASVSQIPTETLNVPETFAPTYACCTTACDSNWPDDCSDQTQPYGHRPWLVDLGDLNGKAWIPFMAAGPAALAFVLVFLDDGITWHLINHPAHKLQHGPAYSYDTLIIGLMILINSILGFPWLVAATVRSLNHVHAMAEKTPDGKITSVWETRLTGLFIHLLCLAAIFALNVLKLIPVPVLYGVFLFMGLVSLGTNQFWGRITMFFMQPNKYPLEPYTVHVKPRRMHYFTLIQLGLFCLLYIVKAIKKIAIAFPIIIALCIPIRLYLLPRIFTEKELVMIDSDDDAIQKWLSDNEEYESELKTVEGDKVTDEEAPPSQPEEEEDEFVEEHDEHEDQVTPLPDIAAERRTRRRTRRKSASCPPHMLFAEVPVTANDIGISMAVPDEGHEHEHELLSTIEEERPRRRRTSKRTKSLSCPPHMLFAEAERHVASNYFFG